MALQTTDEFLVNRGNASYKMPASQLGAFFTDTGLTLQQVTDAGSDTTNGATFGGSVGVGTDSPVSTLSVVSGTTDQGAIDTNNQVHISRSGSATYAAYLSYGRLIGSNNYAFQISALNNNIAADILLAPDGGNVTVGRDKIELKANSGQVRIGDDIRFNINGAGYSRLLRPDALDDSNEVLSIGSGKNNNSGNRGYLFNAGGFYINTGTSAGLNAKAEIIHDDGSASFGSGNITLAADGTVTGVSGKFGNITTAVNAITGSASITIESGGTGGLSFKTKNTNSDYNFWTTNGSFQGKFRFGSLTSNRTYTLPDQGGTIALTANTVNLDGNQTIAGTKTFTGSIQLDGANVNQDIRTIADSTAWSMSDSNLWTTSASTLANPTQVVPGQTGVIFCTNPITGWGNKYKFPEGTPIEMEANSIIPYYVTASNIVRVGYPTNGVN